jgi:predicted enzyme related to lactoylglutathione lyase
MISQIFGVQIKTKNVDKLRKFYSTTLGLTPSHECDGCVVLEIGGGQVLALQKHDAIQAETDGKTPVTFALRVPDIAAAHKALSKAGAEFVGGIEEESWARLAGVVDPDGNRIVLVQEKPGAKKADRCAAANPENKTGGIPGADAAAKSKKKA